MRTGNIGLFLFMVLFITSSLITVADDIQSNTVSFNTRIVTLQNDMRSLCSHMESKTLANAVQLKRLINKVNAHCPAIEAMEPKLANIENMANKHHMFAEDQLHNCNELLKMTTSGLENGNSAVYYMSEGDYTLADDIIDKWDVSFKSFRSTFSVADTPIIIMSKHSEIFYRNNWIETIRSYILTGLVLLLIPILIKWGLVLNLSIVLSTTVNKLVNFFCQRRTLTPINQPNGSFLTFVVQIGIVLGAIAFASSFLPKTQRYDCFPEATSVLTWIEHDRIELKNSISRQIDSIAKLKSQISMHHDKLVQADINELLDNLMRSVQQSHTGLTKAFVSNKKVQSTMTWAHESIETQATKAGRLAKAKPLLAELKKAATVYGKLQRNLEAIMLDQENVIPTLKEHTRTMLKLIQDDRILELRPLINEHQIILTKINGQLVELKVDLNYLINALSNGDMNGMRNTIDSLSNDCFKDQITAIATGGATILGGVGISTFLGIVAIKSGLVMVTITAVPVSVGVGAIGLAAFGLHKIVQEVDKNWNNFTESSRYKAVLAEVQVKIDNFKVTLDQLYNEIRKQSDALSSTLGSIDRITQHAVRYSNMSSITLHNDQRKKINDDLRNMLLNYNEMMATYKLFTETLANERATLPPE